MVQKLRSLWSGLDERWCVCVKSGSTSSHRCRCSDKSLLQPPSLLQGCAPLCQRLSSRRGKAPRTQQLGQLPLATFKIRSDVTHNTWFHGAAGIIPQILRLQREPDPAGASTAPSLHSCNTQVVLIPVLMWCQTNAQLSLIVPICQMKQL